MDATAAERCCFLPKTLFPRQRPVSPHFPPLVIERGGRDKRSAKLDGTPSPPNEKQEAQHAFSMEICSPEHGSPQKETQPTAASYPSSAKA
jgi:hypothetical protein